MTAPTRRMTEAPASADPWRRSHAGTGRPVQGQRRRRPRDRPLHPRGGGQGSLERTHLR